MLKNMYRILFVTHHIFQSESFQENMNTISIIQVYTYHIIDNFHPPFIPNSSIVRSLYGCDHSRM